MSECSCRVVHEIIGRSSPAGNSARELIVHCPRHAEAHVQALEARVRTLEEGVRKYGQHLDSCGWADDTGCGCGLSTLLTTGGET